MSDATRERFWPWYARSARRDGASVRVLRRALNLLIGLGLLVAWWFWMTRSTPWTKVVLAKLAVQHPVCLSGIVAAFVMMGFRTTVLDYLAYSVHAAEGVHVGYGLFGNERGVRRKYEVTFGRDLYYRAPEVCGALSVLLLVISGFALVFSSR
jgi:hypothetical protein